MITGIHALIYTKQAEQVREFFKKTLKFPTVDAGHGWLLFGLPPAEMGVHPTDKDGSYDLYLMCDNLPALMKSLQAKGVSCSLTEQEDWGLKTTIQLPSGGEIGLYQPTHPTAIGMD